MAITVQHGSDGALLGAAVVGGQAAFRERSADRDRALLSQIQRYRLGQQQAEAAEREQEARFALQSRQLQLQEDRFNLQRLQAAAAARQQVQRSATSTDPRRRLSDPLTNSFGRPMTRPAGNAGTGRIQSALGTFTMQPTGEVVRSDAPAGDTRTVGQLRQQGAAGGFVSASPLPLAAENPITDVLNAAVSDPNLTDFGRQQLEATRSLIERGGLTANQAMDMIQDIQRRNQVMRQEVDQPSATSVFNARQGVIKDQIDQKSRELRALEAAQRAAGFTTVQSAFSTQAAQQTRSGNKRQREAAEIAILRNARIKELRGEIDTLSSEQSTLVNSAGQPAAPASAPVRVNSAAEVRALPPGTQFIAPDGQVRTKG